MNLRTFCAAFAILAVTPNIAGALVVSIDITINNPSGMTATGSFNLDPATSTYSDLDVLLTGTIGSFDFNNTSCDACPLSGSSVGLIDDTFSQTTFLQDLQVDFGGDDGIHAIFTGNSFTLGEVNGRIDGTYELKPQSTVPEPATVALLSIALAGLGVARRRKLH